MLEGERSPAGPLQVHLASLSSVPCSWVWGGTLSAVGVLDPLLTQGGPGSKFVASSDTEQWGKVRVSVFGFMAGFGRGEVLVSMTRLKEGGF